MSSNPFRDLPENNPYASPAPGYGPPPSNPLLPPAIILLVLSTLYVMLTILSLPTQFENLRFSEPGSSVWVGTVLTITVTPLMNVVIAFGSLAMIRLKGYRWAYVATIFSLIPFCSPCFILGIPFGIWALVLLNRADVKERFPA